MNLDSKDSDIKYEIENIFTESGELYSTDKIVCKGGKRISKTTSINFNALNNKGANDTFDVDDLYDEMKGAVVVPALHDAFDDVPYVENVKLQAGSHISYKMINRNDEITGMVDEPLPGLDIDHLNAFKYLTYTSSTDMNVVDKYMRMSSILYSFDNDPRTCKYKTLLKIVQIFDDIYTKKENSRFNIIIIHCYPMGNAVYEFCNIKRDDSNKSLSHIIDTLVKDNIEYGLDIDHETTDKITTKYLDNIISTCDKDKAYINMTILPDSSEKRFKECTYMKDNHHYAKYSIRIDTSMRSQTFKAPNKVIENTIIDDSNIEQIFDIIYKTAL